MQWFWSSPPPKIKSATVSTVSPSVCHEVMEPDAMILVFWMLSFKPTFSLSFFTFFKSSLVPFPFLPLVWYHLHVWDCWYFSWKSWFQLATHPAWHFAWHALRLSQINQVTINSLVVLLSQSWTSHCSIQGANCCFLTQTQVSQATGNMVWYSLFKNFPVCYDPHSQRL